MCQQWTTCCAKGPVEVQEGMLHFAASPAETIVLNTQQNLLYHYSPPPA
jgi:hypothetical protein